jgi:predicted acetyltransferase
MEVRPIRPEEVDRYLETTSAAFHGDLTPDHRERWGAPLEVERSWAAFDGEALVGTAGAFTRKVALPGVGLVDAAHVTMVGVLPTHRRLGLLRRMLGEVHRSAPEPFAALWASEGGIYGRFGYGVAARHAELVVDVRRAGFRADAPPAAPVRLAAPKAVLDELRAVFDAVAPTWPGMLDRVRPAWWQRLLQDAEGERDGASSLRAAVLTDGRGYALYAVKSGWEASGPAHTCVLHELVALDPAARAALWRWLLDLDLVATVRWELAPVDEVLPHLLTDRRAVSVTALDALWVALLDVPRALAARGYAAPVDLVLDVVDAEHPTRVRLRAGADGSSACDEAPHAPADLRLGAEALGSLFLGGTTVAELHAAARVEELRAGAVSEATRAFRADREPWCQELF